jgi:ABC-type transporter Mla MlaB component
MVAAIDGWRARPDMRGVLADFERYGEGAAMESCLKLLAVFADGGAAPGLVAELSHALCAALAAEPFGHPPFRHGYERGTSTLLLARRGRAQLVLHACEPGSRTFDVVGFSDGERREVVLAGAANARIVHRQGRFGLFVEQRLSLAPGVRLALDLREEALQVLAVERRLVSLRLYRSPRHPAPSREYDLASGALLRQAAGDIRTSRHEVMLALLGRMQRAEAAPVMAAIAREPGDAALRWQALRECLALDTAEGFAALCHLARAADDPLATPAAALHARLVEAHPELAGQCPA